LSILFGSGSDSDTTEIFRIGSDHQILISAQHCKGSEMARSEIFQARCQAKFLTCEISYFRPCTHAQSNILHTKYADKTDY